MTTMTDNDNTAAGQAPDDDTTIVPDATPTHAAEPIAWSEHEPDDDGRRTWHAAMARAGIVLSVAVVIAAGIAGWEHFGHRDNHAKPFQPNVTSVPPAPPPAPLEGVYAFEFDNAHQTYSGPGKAETPDTRPTYMAWAFRSACTPIGCEATGTGLDNHLAAMKPPQLLAATPSETDVLRLENGRWIDVTPVRGESDCTRPNGSPATQSTLLSWSFRIMPDGTLRGEQVATLDSDVCGDQGAALTTPFVAKRFGPVPPGVAVADPSGASLNTAGPQR